ncbi:hypothetical protein [Grimontia sp. NTOU-MAR1]|uniref:hypothetical protein n=1 Tax=Grimontia sp. NTOU-MAR1 TaxID=3111011 RepID=UPI002DB7C57D|nr:hypothetical protein [Grimontia sp. NTOU-MAR1]WRV98259.1 hypothetical protein VP504_02140 [Grimontia sp. NTOU-MAR1]
MPRLNAGGWKAGDVKIHSGTLDDIPSGWELAADMVDRAVVGAGGAYNVGQQFGADEVTPNITTSVWVNNHTLSLAQMPSHAHPLPTRKPGSSLSQSGYVNIDVVSTATRTSPLNSNNAGSSHAHAHGAGASSSSSAINTRQKSIAVIWIRKL